MGQYCSASGVFRWVSSRTQPVRRGERAPNSARAEEPYPSGKPHGQGTVSGPVQRWRTDRSCAETRCELTKEAVILKSGQSRIYNQIAWARLYLVKAGLLDSSKRGVWSLTEKGRTAELTPDFALPALSEDCITLSGQKHEGFGQLDDFSWQTP